MDSYTQLARLAFMMKMNTRRLFVKSGCSWDSVEGIGDDLVEHFTREFYLCLELSPECFCTQRHTFINSPVPMKICIELNWYFHRIRSSDICEGYTTKGKFNTVACVDTKSLQN